MSAQEFTVYGTLPSLNDVIAANRSGFSVGASQKRTIDERVGWAIKAAGVKPMASPVTVSIRWVEKDRRRDPDNIASAIKFILDALQKQGVLKGDGHRHIAGIAHSFDFNPDNPRVAVTLTEVES